MVRRARNCSREVSGCKAGFAQQELLARGQGLWSRGVEQDLLARRARNCSREVSECRAGFAHTRSKKLLVRGQGEGSARAVSPARCQRQGQVQSRIYLRAEQEIAPSQRVWSAGVGVQSRSCSHTRSKKLLPRGQWVWSAGCRAEVACTRGARHCSLEVWLVGCRAEVARTRGARNCSLEVSGSGRGAEQKLLARAEQEIAT